MTTTETQPSAQPVVTPPPTWFTCQKNLQGVDDATRDRLMVDAIDFISYGVKGKQVILRTQDGFTLCEPREIQGKTLIFFDHMPASGKVRLVWWLTHKQINTLSERLRARPELRDDFLGILADANA
jgi:hypothetical protein